jgi:hypothetical protein
MTAKWARSSAGFVSLERRAWAKTHLLATNASVDFQKFTDEIFYNLRRRYFSPADVAAEKKQRSENKTSTQWRVRRKSSAN